LEWDLLAGPTSLPTATRMPLIIPTLECPTRCGRGMVAGGEAEAGVAGLAGDALRHTGMHGGRIGKYNFIRR